MLILVAVGVALLAFFLVFGYLIDFRFQFRQPELSDLHGRRSYMRGHEPFEYVPRRLDDSSDPTSGPPAGKGDHAASSGRLDDPTGRAILAIHGIAGSAAQLREMSKKLAKEGFHVYGVTLPGHGTDPEDLYGMTWQRWYGYVEAEFDRLHEIHRSVSVMGFSLGAVLGMRLAMNRPVEKLVCMATPLKLFHDYIPMHYLLRLATVFGTTARAFPKRMPESEDGPEYLIYKRIPLEALTTLVDLAFENKPRLGEVKVPALLLHSRRDPASRAKGAQYVYDHLGSEEKRLVWFEQAPHGLMHGSEEDKAVLHSEIVSFLS